MTTHTQRNLLDLYITIVSALGHLGSYLQAYVIFNSSNISGVSFAAFLIGFISTVNWLIYGLIRGVKPLVISNIFGGIGCLLVLLGLMKYS